MTEPWAYVLSYFTTADEALHLAVSRDGATFSPLNNARPVLRGEVGTRALRDPFIGIGPDDQFHLLATDGWTSTSIVHTSSPDLVTWSPQRLLPVMDSVPGALNAWAPEFFFDPESGSYHLLWSSVIDETGSTDRDWEHEGQDHRIWHATTEDFSSIAPPQPFFDPGHAVIDATVHRAGDAFVMAYKDERGRNDAATPDSKHIMFTGFERPGGPFRAPVGPLGPPLTEGPALYRRNGSWIVLFDRYLDDGYGASESRDGQTWLETEIDVPSGTRHASVLTLSHAAARRVGWDALGAKIGTAPDEEWRTQDPPTQEVHQ
jgi:hypothetical protein